MHSPPPPPPPPVPPANPKVAEPITWRGVAELLHAVGKVPAHDLEGLLQVIATQLAALMNAPECILLFSIRHTDLPEGDALGGWRVREARIPHGDAEGEAMIRAYAQAELYTQDPHSIALAQGAGKLRAMLRFDIITEEQWRGSPSDALYQARGMGDHLVGAYPVTADTEILAVLSRGLDEADFTPAERDGLAHAMGHLGEPARRIALSFGAPGRLLSPRERETLSWLLQGHSEKQIAHEMCLAKSTVHEYVVGVYRKVGVSSRAELMARWLNA